MSSPDTEQIKKMVAELDAAVPRDGARVHLSQYGGGPDESKVVGNQRGYLRLGIEFLRAAFAPPTTKSQEQIDADLRYLLTEDSTVGFDWFERREDLTTTTQAERKPSRFAPAIITLVLICGLILAIIGLGTVVVWMTR
jgi:hypothetical protein